MARANVYALLIMTLVVAQGAELQWLRLMRTSKQRLPPLSTEDDLLLLQLTSNNPPSRDHQVSTAYSATRASGRRKRNANHSTNAAESSSPPVSSVAPDSETQTGDTVSVFLIVDSP